MPRRSKNRTKPTTPVATGRGTLGTRSNTRLNRTQQETVIQTYFALGSMNATAKKLGVCFATVKRTLDNAYQDPTLLAVRGKTYDRMAGKLNAVTDTIVDSITPDELTVTRHEVRDAAGNLLRVVREGPSIRDKALAIGILVDKQRVLQDARDRAFAPAVDSGNALGNLLIPDTLEDKRRLIASKVKRLRLLDVEFSSTGDTGQTIDTALNRLGIAESDVADAVVELVPSAAPFD